MEKIKKHERMYINFTWYFILIGIVNHIVSSSFNSYAITDEYLFRDILYYLLLAGITLLKLVLVNQKFFNPELKPYFFHLLKAIDIFIILYGIEVISLGYWSYILLACLVMITALGKGSKYGLMLVVPAFFFHLAFSAVIYIYSTGLSWYTQNTFFVDLTSIFPFYAVLVFFTLFCGKLHKDMNGSETENRRLMLELEEKYEQIAVAQHEIKQQYEKLKETNAKQEDANKKLTASIAEFYTLHRVTQAISSILDIKGLLRYVNDVILGVMGVKNSTIVLYDERRTKLRVHTTNIKDKAELVILNSNINCQVLKEVLYSGKSMIENLAVSEDYDFIRGRGINSFVCVPLNTKTRKFGLVLIEHKMYDAFDESNVRLLNTIGQQVGIALENAELYQRMQELATTDDLTGIYNRVYFQERLERELARAKNEGYKLALAIFDIDHFKKFNDTFGHLFGDSVLKGITQITKNLIRRRDIFARFGGEEFIILFPHTGINEAKEKVERLRENISRYTIDDGYINTAVTVSFGISSYPDTSLSENDLLRHADDALYEAKSAGRNCVKLAKPVDYRTLQ